jgi:lia operon protein LiaG
MRHILGRFLAAVLPVAALGAQTEHRTISGDRVAVYNLAGTLRLQGGAGSQVSVDITRRGKDAAQLKVASGDVRGFNALRVVYPGDRIVYPEMRRGRTQLRVNADGTFDDNEGGWFNRRDQVEIRGDGSGLEAWADIVVSIPRGQRIAVHWGVGQATVSNVDGDVRVSVAAASVTSEHTRGRLNLDTGSGSVSVTDAQGDVTLDTGSGGLSLDGVRGESLLMDTGSGSIKGTNVDVRTLKADVGSGGLEIEHIKVRQVTVDAGSGGVELQFDSTVDDVKAESGSGGVTLRVPSTQTGDVDIETGSGGISTDFSVSTTHVRRNHLTGRIGEGSARIRIEAGSGTVRLLKN